MCGIAGFYNIIVDQEKINSVIDSLYHRGPDEQNSYAREDVGLIHTRLSIIDVSGLGSQPYKFENLVLVFNGELYNYREIREDLKKKGYHFQSNSDTEVLIKAFHCWREHCVDRFIGMFAFSIYDERSDEIFLFRDRVGVKPLYYAFHKGAFYFASELKALSVFPVDKEINRDAVSLYFRYGFIPHQLSIYKTVSKLEPGHFLRVSRKGILKTKYWRPTAAAVSARNENEWLDELEALLISAFRYRMVSDVPIGVFLSGGIDSSLLTAVLQKHHGGLNTFTIGFKESAFDESVYAHKVAKHLGTNHIEKILGLQEARNQLLRFYDIYDEPFADTSGIPTSCVTQLARQHGVKVVLSADGGDELFGGYSHYLNAVRLFQNFHAVPLSVRKLLSQASRTLFPVQLRKKTKLLNLEHKAYALEELVSAQNPTEFFEAFLANQSMVEVYNMMTSEHSGSMNFNSDRHSPLEVMMDWDFQYYLPDDLLVKVDRATMFHSTECREPFLDHRLVEFARSIPSGLKIKDGKGKYLLRKLLTRYLPQNYFERKKQGFSIPIFSWFREELDQLFHVYLSIEKLSHIPFFNAKEILREHAKYLYFKRLGKPYNIEKMWRILSFMMWWETYQRNEN